MKMCPCKTLYLSMEHLDCNYYSKKKEPPQDDGKGKIVLGKMYKNERLSHGMPKMNDARRTTIDVRCYDGRRTTTDAIRTTTDVT